MASRYLATSDTGDTAHDLSSFLTISVFHDNEEDGACGNQSCAICLQASTTLSPILSSCSHGVCQTCADIINGGKDGVVCVKCQIRSVSPFSHTGSPVASSPSCLIPGVSNEKHRIVQLELLKAQHLDDAVYKPLIRHFDNLLAQIRKGAEKSITLIESRFEELAGALIRRKDEMVKTIKKRAKANRALVEKKKNAAEKARTDLRAYRKNYRDKLQTPGNRPDEIVVSRFLTEIDDFKRQARRISTDNSTTELDDIEVLSDPEVERSIKEAADRVVILRDVTCHHPSRVGTPISSPYSPAGDSTSSDISSPTILSQVGIKRPLTRSRASPNSLKVPSQRQRAQSAFQRRSRLLPNTVSPRNVRSAADGCENDHTASLHPTPTRRPSGNRIEEVGPSGHADNDSDNDVSALSIPGSLSSQLQSSDNDARTDIAPSQRILIVRDSKPKTSTKRLLPNVLSVTQTSRNETSPQVAPRVKRQTLMRNKFMKLERPSGVCYHYSNDREQNGVLVADCGVGMVAKVGLDGRVICDMTVCDDDGESVKAHGVFDVAVTDDHVVVISESHQKKILLLRQGRRPQSVQLPTKTDPRGLTSYGQHIFICDQGNQCVQSLDLRTQNGAKPKFTTIHLGKPNKCLPICPYFISVESSGQRILVTDYGNGALILARTDNTEPPRRVQLVLSSATSQNDRSRSRRSNIDIRPTGVAWMPDGRRAVVADQLGHRLVVVDEELTVVGTYGRQGSAEGEFLFPHGIHVVADSVLAVCDMNNARMQFIPLATLCQNLN